MEKIYQSDYLSIHVENEIMIQEWSQNPLTNTEFKKELKSFLKIFKKQKPRGVLWLQEYFDLQIPEDLYQWIEKNILMPQYKAGLRKLAFTVPIEQLAHLSIIDSFNNVSSVLQPRYFLSKEKALNYINEKETALEEANDLIYALRRTLDTTEITFNVDHKHLPHAIRNLEKLKTQFKFRVQNKDYFDQLTLRELEIFKEICEGKLNKTIAAQLFLSESTIATHRKTINKKLNIKTPKDWQLYADAFL